MYEAFLVTTSSEGLKPLGTPPQRSFELVSGTILQRLSEAHAHLFAEPVSTSFGDRLDWYAPHEGKARLLSDLKGNEATEAQARLDSLMDDIRKLAHTIGASNDPEEQRLAESLENALQIPGPEFIYIIAAQGNDVPLQPVLVNWARVLDQQHSVRGALTGADRRTPKPKRIAAATGVAAATVPASTQSRTAAAIWPYLWWLGWFILGLIIAAILYLLIPACGLRGTSLFSYCQAPVAPISANDAETRSLEDQIARMERQLAIADRACQPPAPVVLPPPPPPPPPKPKKAQQTEIDRRLARAGAKRGDLSFSLAWNSRLDLDLHVTCPTGKRIWARTRATCRGVLDVDANQTNGRTGGIGPRARMDPVENTYFKKPIPGNYKIMVRHYQTRTPNIPQKFTLQIRDGSKIKTLHGSVSPRKRDWTYNYTVRNN